MNEKQIRYMSVQTNHIVKTICAILFLSFSHSCYAQIYLDTNKIFATEEDWSQSIDGLLQKGILDTTNDAWALLKFKVNRRGIVVSANIVRSANIDPSLFYSICATIEDCYDTPFLKDEIRKYQDHIVNGFLYLSLMRRFPKSSGLGLGHSPISEEKTN